MIHTSAIAGTASIYCRACLWSNFKSGVGAHQMALLLSMDCWNCLYIWCSAVHWEAETGKTREKKSVFVLSKNCVADFCIPGKLTVWADKSSGVFMNMCIICCSGRRDWQECCCCDPICFCSLATNSFKESLVFFHSGYLLTCLRWIYVLGWYGVCWFTWVDNHEQKGRAIFKKISGSAV